MELSDEPPTAGLLQALATAVLTHVGYTHTAVAGLEHELLAALRAGATAGHPRCDIRFRAHAGELHISVACAGGREWRTIRRLP